MIVNNNINFTAGKLSKNNVFAISNACKRLGNNLTGKNVKIDRYTSLSAQKTSDGEDLYQVILKISKNNTQASVSTTTPKPSSELKKYLTENCREAAKNIQEQIQRLFDSIKKASKDEAKSLTDF